jgi:hypothetical protein
VITLLTAAACRSTAGTGAGSGTDGSSHTTSASAAPSGSATTAPEPPLATREFDTPSGNIHCVLARALLLCEIGSRLQPQPDGTCETPSAWLGVILPNVGGATPECSSHTAVGVSAPTLDYGDRWERAGISCDSESTGLTCTNAIDNGFFLSREEWHPISFTSGPAEHAQFFQTPSHNIACATAVRTLRCDILSGLDPEPTGDCPLDWVGLSVAAGSTDAGPQCAGDTVLMDGETVLEYGTEWRRAGFTCDSSETGLYCWNAWGHGFLLSRDRWKTF